MTIFEQLGFTDLEFGEIQSVDEMTVLPILGNDRDEGVSAPEEIVFQKTQRYGEMVFQNAGDGIGIVLNNTMIISDKKAQDHCMCDTGVLPAKQMVAFNNAACIQSAQSGFLSGEQNQYDILPLELRKVLLNRGLRYSGNYTKLWNSIEAFQKNIPQVEEGAHLEYFFRAYEHELNDFVAEFEPVDRQLGAVIFFNLAPVGLEFLPSNKHWEAYWRWILRGCYGAQLLKLRLTGKIQPQKLDFKGDIQTFIDQLTTAVIEAARDLPSVPACGAAAYGDFRLPCAHQEDSEAQIRRNEANANTDFQKIFLSQTDSSCGGDIIQRRDKVIYASIVY